MDMLSTLKIHVRGEYAYKTGDVSKYHAGELGKTISNNPISIDGGMATMLDLPLNPVKELKSLSLETTANEVVIGLMGVTLVK